MQFRNPLCLFVGFNQNFLRKTNHFSHIIRKAFLCHSGLNLIKEFKFLFSLIFFLMGFLCQFIRHLGAFNLFVRKEISGDWCVMGAEKGITADIFQDKINGSLSDGHSIVCGSSPPKFINDNKR